MAYLALQATELIPYWLFFNKAVETDTIREDVAILQCLYWNSDSHIVPILQQIVHMHCTDTASSGIQTRIT